MHKRLKTIHKYYNNLEYNKISKEDALKNIQILTRRIQFKNISSNRFSFVATLIKDNFSIFQSACEHIDIVTNIIQVLNEIDTMYEDVKRIYMEEHTFDGYFLSLMIVVLCTWKEYRVQLFFEDIILKDMEFDCQQSIRDKLLNLKTFLIAAYYNEMILLEDSDLYAVISYLMMQQLETRKFSLDKIWVHKQIQEKFLSLLKKKFHHSNFPIHIFRFKEELLTSQTDNCIINITSIWSENIIAAKNLAFSLHKDVIYINTHMDFCSILNIPQRQIHDKASRDVFSWHLDFEIDFIFIAKQDENVDDNTQNYPVYNPFYDGVWKLVNTYMICKGSRWARITLNDIKNCINSAKKGFEIWSTMSFNSRMQVLSNFAFTLQCNGKFLLANIISRLIQGSYFVKTSSLCYERGRFEVTVQHKPIGFIFLKEENEITLFSRLIQILITGNSVIVLCDANSYNLAPYCNMFATAEIPPGVINMLPSESLENLETFLFGTTYADYMNTLFAKNRSNNILDNYLMLKYLCIRKQIVVAIE